MRIVPALALLGASLIACSVVNEVGPTTCDRSESANPPVVYKQGALHGNVYTSAELNKGDCTKEAPDCNELLSFPGGMRYRIEHQLGVEPTWFEFYVSFDQFGTEAGTLALAAGNQAELRSANATDLVVVNGSCSGYWLLVFAGTDSKP